MKIVILYSKNTRQINGPFAICGSKEDLQMIIDRLQEAIDRGFSYGWVHITERVKMLPNTPPISWDEKGEEESNEKHEQ